MIKLLQEYIWRQSSGNKVLSLFILTNFIYVFMLVVTIPKVMGFANGLITFSRSSLSKIFLLLGKGKRLNLNKNENSNPYFERISCSTFYWL